MPRKLLVRAFALVCAAMTVAAAWWLYDFGKSRGAVELPALRASYADLEREHGRLVGEGEELRRRIAILDRSSQIDRQAAQEIKDELSLLQEELQAARQEIEFYRGIVSPGEARPGLHIHNFTLDKGSAAGEYHYDLVLTQLKRNDRYVQGRVDWKILGTLENEARSLNLAEVTEPETDHLSFRFRYFQHLTGVLVLPEAFVAQEVVLNIKPTGKYQPEPVEQAFGWPVVEHQ